MMPMVKNHLKDAVPEALSRRALTVRQKVSFIAVLVIASLLGAVIAVASSSGLSFGTRAVAEAGENPPRDVSLKVESLLALQAYANALLTGTALASLLAIAAWILCVIQGRCIPFTRWEGMRSFCSAVVIGGACLLLACLAFRMQTVGTQDLMTAALIHALLWAGLGLVVADRRNTRNLSGWRMPFPVIAGFVWGASFPTLVVLSYPDVYVERLFSTDGLIGLWAGVGCAVLLIAGPLEDSKRHRSSHSERESGAIQ